MFSGFYDVSKRPVLIGAAGSQPKFKDPDAPVNPDQCLFEFTTLLEIYKKLSPKVVVEIGSCFGGSLYQWMKHAKPGTKVVSIDLPGAAYGHPQAAQYVGQWPKWAPPGIEFHSIQANSADPATKQRLLQITDHADFLFIDGNHTYAGVRSDFLMYGPLVKSGGIIVLHDITPNIREPLCEVHRLWQEIREAGYACQDLYVSPNQGGYGIGVIYVQ